MPTREEKMRAKVETFVQPELQPGEQVVAVAPLVQTGPAPIFPALSAPLLLVIRMKAIVVTTTRVIILRCSFTSKPKGVESTHPKGSVKVTRWQPVNGWSRLALSIDGEPLKLNVHPACRAATADTVEALGGAKAV